MTRGFAARGDDENAGWQLLFGVGLLVAGLLIALVTSPHPARREPVSRMAASPVATQTPQEDENE